MKGKKKDVKKFMVNFTDVDGNTSEVEAEEILRICFDLVKYINIKELKDGDIQINARITPPPMS